MAIFTGIAALAGAVATAAGSLFTVAGAASFILKTVVGIGLSLALNAIAGKKAPQAASFGVQGKLQAGGDVPRAFLFGTSATAGSLVYAGEWGQSGKTPNAYHTEVIAIADYPVKALTEVWINGAKVTPLWGETPTAQGYPIEQYRKNGKDHCWIRFYAGTQTTADAFLVATFGAAEKPWTSTRVGRGIAYAVITCLVSDELWTGWPTFRFATSGAALYDISKDSTAGGSGSHRWDNPATWGGDGDDLPAVQIYNLLRGLRWSGQWLYGLQSLPAARLPAADWIAAITACRASIAGISGNEPTYRAGGQFAVSAPLAEAVNAMVTACHGRLAEIGGIYKLRCGAPGEAVFAIDDGMILSSSEQSFTPFLGLAQTINGISARYPSPEEGWNNKVAPPIYRSDLEALDGGRRLMADLTFELVPYAGQVQRLMASALAEGRRARRHTLVLPPEAFVLEPGDVVSWTSLRNGYSGKLFRVDGIVDRANLDVLVDITEVDPGDYGLPAGGYRTIVNGPLLPVLPPAQAIADFAVSAVLTEAFAGIAIPGIRIQWNGTNIDDVVGVEYQVKRFESDAILVQGQAPASAVAAGSHVISGGIAPATSYQVRARFVPGSGRTVTWSGWKTVVTFPAAITLQALDSPLRQMIQELTGFGVSSVREMLREYEARLESLGEAVGRAVSQSTILMAKVEGKATAAIVEERFVRASADEAAAGVVLGLTATLSDLDDDVTGMSTVVNETYAAVTNPETGLVALASDLNTLTTTVGDTSTTVTNHTTSITNLEGETYGSWGVQIATQKNIIGATVKKWAGIKLHQAGGAGEIVSELRIDSDRFSIFPAGSDPDTNTYDTPLFTIGSVGGGPSNRAGINALAVLDGTLQARMLVADEVVVANTIQLQNSIVTVPHIVTYSTPVAGTGIGNLIDIVDTMFEVTIPNGQTIPIFFNGGMSLEYLNTSTTRWDLDFKVSWRPVGGSYGAESSLFAMTCGSTATVATPFGGAYSITGTGAIQQVRARLVWTAASNIRAGNRYLSCQAAKR